MNEQNTTPNPVTPPVAPAEIPVAKPSLMSQISAKIPPKIKEAFNKFYAKKIIFWPVSIVFGLLFLTIVAGLLFGSRKGQPAVKKTPTPTPITQENTQQQSPGTTDSKLNDLKNQIQNLDIEEKRLQPPTIDFKVSF